MSEEEKFKVEELKYFIQLQALDELFYRVRIFLDGIASNYCECAKADKAAAELKEYALMLLKEIDAKVFHQSLVEKS